MPTPVPASLEQLSTDLATLRGQVDRLTEVLTFLNMASPGPNNPASGGGSILYSLGDQVKYASGDGNDYSTGRVTVSNASAFTVSSGADVTVPGMSVPVTAGVYRIFGSMTWTQGGALGQNMGFTGPAINNCRINNEWILATGFAQGGVNYRQATAMGTFATPAYANGTVSEWDFNGIISFSAAGTLAMAAHQTGTNFVFAALGWMDVMPVS